MKRVVVMTPSDVRHGFALTGVRQRTPVPGQLPDELSALLDDPTVGLVIVDERLVDDGTQVMLRQLERQSPGVVVILPSPRAAVPLEEDYILRLVRRALGYQVRLGA